MLSKIKEKTDGIIIQKVKTALIKTAEEHGIPLQDLLTPSIEKKFDDLAREILKEHGYKKLAVLGLKKIL